MTSEKKNIMFIIDSLAQGGAENVCVTLANGLVRRGWSVQLCVLKRTNNALGKFLDPNIKVDFLDVQNIRTGSISIYNYIRDKSPSKIMCFFYQTALLLILLKIFRLLNARIIVRNVSTLSRKHAFAKDIYHKFFLKKMTACLYPKADFIIAQSEGMKYDLITHYNVVPQNISIIYNPIKQTIENFQAFDALSSPAMVDFLCVGRLMKVKGYEDVLQALSKLKTRGVKPSLRIIGDGPEDVELHRIANDLNVADQVEFTGVIDNIAPYYTRARATILSSRYEGFPNVLVESIFVGTPIVAYDCESGPREIVTAQNGILVAPNNVEKLADAMEQALKTDWNKDAIKNTALKYSSKNILDEYEAILMN